MDLTSYYNDNSTDTWEANCTYSEANDIITIPTQCPIVLGRIPGSVSDDNCTGGSCSEGGTGDITGCQADFDCGRCWYCDNGTCRYGGEGPYGCYRGWDPGD
jgi:hypothetical protein